MQAAINIVRGAVAKKSLLPVLTHFRIYGGRIQGGNGRISIDAPCPELEGLDLCVPADRFIKAVDACKGEPKLHLTDGGRLALSRGKFRAYLPVLPSEEYPLAERGNLSPACGQGDWLTALRSLEPFIGEDASKLWSLGVWLFDGYGYATNNATLARFPTPWSSLDAGIILPGFVVEELLRIGQEPDGVCYGDGAVVFDLPGGVWLRSVLLDGDWPETVPEMLSGELGTVTASGEVLEALEQIRPFCPNDHFPVICLQGDGVRTEEGEMSAHVEGLQLTERKWHADVLENVLKHSTRIDFEQHPCPWEHDNGLKGVAMPLNL